MKVRTKICGATFVFGIVGSVVAASAVERGEWIYLVVFAAITLASIVGLCVGGDDDGDE